MIYQFAFHSRVKQEPTDCTMFELYRKVYAKEKLTREEKDRIADRLYGVLGQHSATYKYLGYAAPFHRVLDRFLVRHKHDDCWREYYVPDRTSLRKALRDVVEIVSAPIRKK